MLEFFVRRFLVEWVSRGLDLSIGSWRMGSDFYLFGVDVGNFLGR